MSGPTTYFPALRVANFDEGAARLARMRLELEDDLQKEVKPCAQKPTTLSESEELIPKLPPICIKSTSGASDGAVESDPRTAPYDGPPMCRQGASIWMNCDYDLLRGVCRRCGAVMPRVGR